MSLRRSETGADTIDDVNGTPTIDPFATNSTGGITPQHRVSSSDSSIECISLIDDESDSENHKRNTETGLNENDDSTARNFES